VQAQQRWTPPAGVLGALVAEAEARARALRPALAELRERAGSQPATPAFAAALRGATVALLCEIKRRSPSRGAINPGLALTDHARAYVRGGAAALSIHTEESRFGGAAADLPLAASAVHVPLLRKDFLVSPDQLLEARALGASAALLIARALPPGRLADLHTAALELGLETLVEVRDERELVTAIDIGAAVIGVNSRDLETLTLDAAVGDRLLPLVPADRVAVWESGVQGRADVERAARAGADAVLVGSSISAAGDPEAAVAALAGVGASGGRVAA
jgi:indole-3-glycerol phosphate synthase